MFQTFQSLPGECKAYQFTTDLFDKGLEYCPGIHVDEGYMIVITANGNRARVQVGDWIVAEADGVHHYPVQDAIFKKRWRLKPSGDFAIDNRMAYFVETSEEIDLFAISFAAWTLSDEAKVYITAGATAGELLDKYKSRPYIDTNPKNN